ncbi:MAG: hypothetical protein ACE5FU_11155, partial [Nitrospinota bacterium]
MGEEKQAIDPDIPPAQTGELGGGEKEGLSGALKNTDSEQPNDTERVIPAEKTQKGVKEKQSGNLVFKVAKGFVYVLVPVLFFGCLYYLRGLSIKVDALHSRMDKIALRLEG